MAYEKNNGFLIFDLNDISQNTISSKTRGYTSWLLLGYIKAKVVGIKRFEL